MNAKAGWMRMCLLGCLLFGVAGEGLAQPESLTVSIGSAEIVEVPFIIEGYTIVNRDVVSATQLPGQRRLQISGRALGSSDLLVTGGGREQVFQITVVENINDVLMAMMRDLDTVPEVELSINLGRVVVKGEVNSIDNWDLLKRVIRVYEAKVVNLATFRPAPEVMHQLTDSLKQAGFTLLEADEPLEPGKVRLRWSGNTIFIGAQLYAASDERRLRDVVRTHPWLVVVDNLDQVRDGDARVRALLQTEVIPTMLEVEVAFVGVSDVEYQQIGVNLARAGLMAIDTTSAAFQGTIGKTRASGFGGSYTISSGLQGALSFFRGTGPGRFIQEGHMSFRNDSPDWSTYQSGGTLKVRIATRDTVGLEDIDYGMILRTRGGLSDPDNVSLDLNLELSYPLPVGTDYDLKRNTINTTISCPLGHTLVLGGMRGLAEQSSSEGVPFLRSVPVLQWLFSEQNRIREDNQVLIMVSPNLAGAPRLRETVPLSETSRQVEVDAATPVQQREREQRGRRFFFR